jgi:hypothetical protein
MARHRWTLIGSSAKRRGRAASHTRMTIRGCFMVAHQGFRSHAYAAVRYSRCDCQGRMALVLSGEV